MAYLLHTENYEKYYVSNLFSTATCCCIIMYLVIILLPFLLALSTNSSFYFNFRFLDLSGRR